MSNDQPIVVLGAGLTGLSTALHAAENPGGRKVLVLERDERVGGKAQSRREAGYTFDITGHWLHLRDDRIKALIDRLFAPGDLSLIERKTGIHSHGVMLRYPFQANLHGLPLEVVQECLVGFIDAQRQAATQTTEPQTFEQFAVARFGEGIARHFFVPYNRKLWGDHYDALTPDWVSRFVPIPDVDQVVGGAIGLPQEGLGYNASFSYPTGGGIDHVPRALAAAVSKSPVAEVRLGSATEVVSIDPASRRVTLADGSELQYGALVSTMPLPSLVQCIQGAPASVRKQAGRLRHIGWRYLDVATRTPAPIEEHWVYVPEPSIPFFRVGIYSNALPAMAPPGCSSLYVELADRDTEPDLPAILTALAKLGAITSPDDVLFARTRDIEYAYVVFDQRLHRSAREAIVRPSRQASVSVQLRPLRRAGSTTRWRTASSPEWRPPSGLRGAGCA